jgi:hypothetical protein
VVPQEHFQTVLTEQAEQIPFFLVLLQLAVAAAGRLLVAVVLETPA